MKHRDIVKVGILSREEYQKRILDIAAGKIQASKDEPKIWFSSMKSMSEVLSDKNVDLLHMIEKQRPKNIRELSDMSGRQQSNLSRTLTLLEKYGIVELKKNGNYTQPIAKATKFQMNVGF